MAATKPAPYFSGLFERLLPRAMMTVHEYPPATSAPIAGIYEQRNIFGAATGTTVYRARGELLPDAPRGFTWSLVERDGESAAAK